MTNAELLAKIKSEIERRIKIQDDWAGRKVLPGRDLAFAVKEELKQLLSFLDTLESEKQSGHTIEEPIDGVLYAAACGIKNAAGKSEKPTIPDDLEKEIDFQTFSKEMGAVFALPKERTENTEEEPLRWEYEIARHFAEWGADHTPLPEDTVLFNKGVEEGKRLMMEEAVEGQIYGSDGSHWIETDIDENIKGKEGDKVRVIVIPNTDEK